MIVVDTNVLSEVMRPAPDPAVVTWLERHGAEIVIASVTLAELLFGVLRLPDGARKQLLGEAIESTVAAVEVLPFGQAEAAAYAAIRAAQEAAGLVAGGADIQIAAIAATGYHQLATRNTSHFAGSGVVVVNPWTDR